MGRIINAAYFQDFYFDSEFWDGRYVEDNAVEIFDEESGEWELEGDVDLEECGDIYSEDGDYECTVEEFFTRWESEGGKSPFTVVRVKILEEWSDEFVDRVNDLAVDLGFEIEIL